MLLSDKNSLSNSNAEYTGKGVSAPKSHKPHKPNMKTTTKTRVRDQKTHRHTFRLNDEQQACFLSMWERSGTKNKSKFILGRLFG